MFATTCAVLTAFRKSIVHFVLSFLTLGVIALRYDGIFDLLTFNDGGIVGDHEFFGFFIPRCGLNAGAIFKRRFDFLFTCATVAGHI